MSNPVALPRRPAADQAPLASRFRGCLLAGAVGDALGAPVEFHSLSEIRRHHGAEGIRDYVPAYGRIGAITDDTQMTLFTAEGLLRGWVRFNFRGIGPVFEGVTANAYLRWLRTQGRKPRVPEVALRNEDELDEGLLMGIRELHSVRAPGNTCLSALEALTSLDARASNNSKGCGGVMRVAPVALFLHRAFQVGKDEQMAYAFRLGANLAGITHGHPTGKLAAGAFVAVLLGILEGATLGTAIDGAARLLRAEPDYEETLNAILRAQRLAHSGMAADRAIAELGEGWTAGEALSIALYCALTARDLESGIIAAVNHDGDSDSTGSIAGNILGAIHGERAIPERWLRPLELRDLIADVADDLFMCPEWEIGEYTGGAESEFYWKRYPGY